jgi:O-antigen/teichoic acid export membrane protein
MLLKKLNNTVINFILSKYLAFAIQLINSVFIAKNLGLYYFGVYGFCTLIIQYLSYSNLGINFSYSVLCSDVNTKSVKQDITNSIMNIQLIISFSLLIIFAFTYSLNLFPKYNFNEYYFLIIVTSIIQHVNNLYVNIFRIENKIKEINLFFLIVPISQLIVLILFKDKTLFYSLLYAVIIGNFISLLIFLKSRPIDLKKIIFFKFSMARKILGRGLFLLVYNLTFYGIILTARTVVSHYFSIENFGLFNFSNSISNAIFLLLGSLNFLFYPKLINSISKKTNQELVLFIENIRMYYLTLTMFIVLISIMLAPILFYFLPQYKDSIFSLQILILAQLIINNSFGYSTLLIQRSKEFLMTIFATISIIIVIVASIIGIKYSYRLETVAFAVVLGVIVYNLLIVYLGSKSIGKYRGFIPMIIETFNYKLFSPIILFIFLSIYFNTYYINISITVFLYLFLNLKEIREIKTVTKTLLRSDGSILTIDKMK